MCYFNVITEIDKTLTAYLLLNTNNKLLNQFQKTKIRLPTINTKIILKNRIVLL